MTKRRLAVLLAGVLVVAAGVGALVYSRTSGPAPDDTGAKVGDTPPPAPVTKATAPARELNEKERMLVGKWKLVSQHPPPNPKYDSSIEYREDSFFTTHVDHPIDGALRLGGNWQITGGTLVRTLRSDIVQVEVIQSLTERSLLTTAQLGRASYEYQWERILP
jgi:hypothetical protein